MNARVKRTFYRFYLFIYLLISNELTTLLGNFIFLRNTQNSSKIREKKKKSEDSGQEQKKKRDLFILKRKASSQFTFLFTTCFIVYTTK